MQKTAFIVVDFMPIFVFLDCYIIYRLPEEVACRIRGLFDTLDQNPLF